MAGKGSYGSAVSKFDKGALVRKLVIGSIIFFAVTGALTLYQQFSRQKKEAVKAELASTPVAVPSGIRYYDPDTEDSYETGTDYIIISDGGERVKVDSSGTGKYIDANGNVTGVMSDDELAAYRNLITEIMSSDYQARMALSGIEQKLTVLGEEEPEPEREPTKLEILEQRLEGMGIEMPEFINAVGIAGSSVDSAIALMDMMPGKEETVIRSVMKAAEAKQAEKEEKAKADAKMLDVEVSSISPVTTGLENLSYENITSGVSDYPEWLQMPDYTEGLTAAMDTLAAAAAGTPTLTAYEQQNRQGEKSDWVQSRQKEAEVVSGRISKYDLVAGTVVPITLVTGLNTDLPGEVIGLVRQDVYDSLTGTEVLIPKGSRLMADYNNSVTFGQTSVQIAWNQLITPDGYTFSLPGFQGVSPDGFSGAKATKVKTHFWSILGGAILGSIIDYGAGEVSKQATNAVSSLPGAVIIAGSADAAINTSATIGKKYTDMWMNQQPTLIIKTGAQMELLVNQTVRLKRENT